MMRRILDFFFDLDLIPGDASGLELDWARPMPGWAWFLAILAASIFAIWSYSRLQGSAFGRGVLASARAMVILLLVVLIAGPQIRYPREDVERDVVLVLLDRSGSMAISDAPAPTGRTSREQQLARLLDRSDATWRSISERSELRWLGFSSGVYPLEPIEEAERDAGTSEGNPPSVLPALVEPTGWRTDLAGSLRQALDGVASRPLSGVVVFSDGRSTAQPDRSLVRRLQQDAIPVFTVPLGSSEPIQDVGIGETSIPRRAFVRDSIPIIVDMTATGMPDEEPVIARLLDPDTGEILDRKTIEIMDGRSEIMLNANLEEPGERRLVVELEATTGDLIGENDRRELIVEVIDRPIRVLYIEGYPRWEYRYLKNLLVREESIESSVMLISADRDFAQEGNTPISRLPRTPEEFEQFDLIIIGDVPSGFFSPEQLRLIGNQVAERGTGLFWIGGSRNTPSSWAGSPLDDLLPIRSPLDLERVDDSVIVEPSMLSRRLGVLILDPSETDGWAPELSDPETGWSRLRSVQKIDPGQIKPTAEVLAIGTEPSGEVNPILLSMRYGAGQVLYATMDDIWRWRFGRGETLTERWWVGLVRMLARQALDSSGKALVLEIAPDELVPGSTARITLSVVDERLSESLGDGVDIEIRDEEGRAFAELELLRENGTSEWSTEWFPERTGRFELHLMNPLLIAESRSMGPSVVEVVRPDDEFRVPDTNHQLLEDLSASTGGAVLDLESMENLPSLLPNREVLIENPIIVPIWNSGAMFFLLLGLLAFEWIGRRMLRMI
jgi:hypothetical protein